MCNLAIIKQFLTDNICTDYVHLVHHLDLCLKIMDKNRQGDWAGNNSCQIDGGWGYGWAARLDNVITYDRVSRNVMTNILRPI